MTRALTALLTVISRLPAAYVIHLPSGDIMKTLARRRGSKVGALLRWDKGQIRPDLIVICPYEFLPLRIEGQK